MDQRVSLEGVSQPQPERHQGVARRQRGIMIVGAPLGRTPAVRWQRDDDVAANDDAKPESAVAYIGIVGRIAPRLVNARCRLGRQIRQVLNVGSEGERRRATAYGVALFLLPSPNRSRLLPTSVTFL